MYIKQVIIEGFKSYREQVAPEPFSPKINCVVGPNGSGKTNFFHAIRFVLSDLYQTLRTEDRQSLLHEGTGGQVITAYVELVFDNSDNRLPVDKEEVRLRRVIGTRKDEYYLDKKHINKSEVMNLLESAGFSRSNPYYVVQQGKIMQLSLMKDSERLSLLKEIGGAVVYEDRRRESLKLMEDAESRRRQIVDVVSFIEARLKELDEEKEELRQYQTLDKQRRALEYTIFEKELQDCKDQLDKVEAARAAVQEKSREVAASAQERHDEAKRVDKELKAMQREREQLDSAKEAADGARAATVQDVTRLELDVNELRTRSVEDRHRRGRAEAELRRVEADIAASRDGLAHTQQELEAEQAREAELARRMAEGEKRRDALYQKQGQGKQFRNKRERDEWLRNDIRGIEQVMQKKQTQAEALDSEIAVLRGEVGSLEAAIEQRQRDVEKGQSELSRAEQAIAHARQQRDDKAAKRKQLMKQDDEMARDMKRVVEDRENATAMLDKTAPRDALRGINSLRQIVREHQIEGVHGPLLELIDCDELFQTAVEVTAGSSLYNVVVDTDAVAARLVRYLNERKGGRITFIPLNQARAPRVDYPDNPDTVPLISKLRYDARFRNAFGQVFGRTLLCKDINVAADMARAGSFDCITIEGSRVERKGAMTGGHYDNKRSKLKLMRTIKESAGRLEQLQHEKNRVQTEINKVDQAVAKALGEVEKQEAQAAHVRNNVEHARREARDLKSQLTLKRQALDHKEKAVAGIREALEAHAADVAARRRELQSDMQAGLAAHEQAALERLLPELDALKKEHVRCRSRRMEVEARLSAVETTLSENLLRRQDELQAELDTLQVASRGTELGGIEAELAAARAASDDALKEHKSVCDRIAAVEKELRSLKAAKDDLKRKEEECERVLQDEGKVLEGLLNERNLVNAKREELNRKIRDLGVFPADAFDKYQRHSLKELHRMLHRCNESVKKFGHVNKKALDQYSTFTEQREEMRRRQRELDEGDEKIKELIKVLDQRKDEALERTFKQVARSFRETFAELVPGGTGSLVMVRKKADDDAVDDDDDDDGDRRDGDAGGSGRVDKYSGVRVKVSFTGRGETQSMRQLSGGQKTVVALSLIFAIQACDPAPFYLFDEIDAALDPQYRSAVANMIRGRADAAQPTQFIVTTFRPELVKVADKVYGVDHRNRVSTVKVVGLEAGLRFVEADQGAQTRD